MIFFVDCTENLPIWGPMHFMHDPADHTLHSRTAKMLTLELSPVGSSIIQGYKLSIPTWQRLNHINNVIYKKLLLLPKRRKCYLFLILLLSRTIWVIIVHFQWNNNILTASQNSCKELKTNFPCGIHTVIITILMFVFFDK